MKGGSDQEDEVCECNRMTGMPMRRGDKDGVVFAFVFLFILT